MKFTTKLLNKLLSKLLSKFLSDLYKGVHLKGTRKFGSKIISRHFFKETLFLFQNIVYGTIHLRVGHFLGG